MYCPKCSIEASTEQRFCRACGMELQAVAELVQSDSSSQKHEPKGGSVQMRHRAMLIWGCVAMFGAGGVGSALKILGKEGIRPLGEFTPYVLALAVVAALLGMALMCLASLGAVSPGRGSKKQPAGLQDIVNAPVAQLPDQPSSITEKTTEFLEDAAAPIRVRDTAPHNE